MPQASGEVARQSVIRDFATYLGRQPTEIEIAQLAPSYQTDYNGLENGRQAIATYAQLQQQKDQTPDKLYAQQQAEYLKNAPQHYADVQQAFKSLLGRDPTQQEKDHFGSILASGQVDPYQLSQFLQQTPEYQQAQDTNFRNNLRGELTSSDAKYLNDQVLPGIQSDYANSGRSFDSSGFKQAFANAAQGQNTQRDQYLAQLSASMYGGNKANARSDYENYVQGLNGLQTAGLNRNMQIQDTGLQRNYQMQDYQLQKQQYDDYLRRYGKRDAYDWANLGINGANVLLKGAGAVGGMSGGGAGASAMPIGLV